MNKVENICDKKWEYSVEAAISPHTDNHIVSNLNVDHFRVVYINADQSTI